MSGGYLFSLLIYNGHSFETLASMVFRYDNMLDSFSLSNKDAVTIKT